MRAGTNLAGRAALAAVAVAAVFAVGGCTGSASSPDGSKAPPTTTTAAPLPQAAPVVAAPVEKAVQELFVALRAAYGKGDPAPLKQISTEKCVSCQQVVKVAEAIKKDNLTPPVGASALPVRSIQDIRSQGDRATAQVTVDDPASPAGQATPKNYQVQLVMVQGTWRVDGLTEN